MKIEEIKTIVKMMGEYQLTEFTIEADGCNISIKRGAAAAPAAPVAIPAAVPAVPAVPAAEPEKVRAAESVVSPLVGTYYSSPSPDSPPFVAVGDRVTPDTVICIIEAMKVMNEIKAEKSGVVREILAQNGQPVEFGQVLVTLE